MIPAPISQRIPGALVIPLQIVAVAVPPNPPSLCQLGHDISHHWRTVMVQSFSQDRLMAEIK